MSTETLPSPAPVAVAAPAAKPGQAWLVAPWFDLFFMANLAWPVLFLVSLLLTQWAYQPLTLVQIYFLSTPHRWITLVLVFLDPVNFPANPRRFGAIGLALVGAGAVLAVAGYFHPYGQQTLYLLMMVDYVWNAWHFGAQHMGIARIYARVGQRQQDDRAIEFEKGAIRGLVLWTFLRAIVYVATQPGQRMAEYADSIRYIFVLDYLFVGQALLVLLRERSANWAANRGRLIYLVSVVSAYVIQLAALQTGHEGMIKSAFLVQAVFHAMEYLAIVSWSVSKKKGGVWTYLAPRTALFVLVFMMALGISNYVLAEHVSLYAWTLVTLLVSLLHYGYDGIIWKSKPKPAAAPASA